MSEPLSIFLEKARAKGAIRFELKTSENTVVRAWDLPPVEGAIDVEACAQEIEAIAEEDAEGLRQSARYSVVAFNAAGEWGRKTLVTSHKAMLMGMDAKERRELAPFTENDATTGGLITELIRAGREKDRGTQLATQAIIDRLMEFSSEQSIVITEFMKEHREFLKAMRELNEQKEEREIRLRETVSRNRTLQKMGDTVSGLLPVVASRFTSHATGNKTAMLPDLLERVGHKLFDTEKGQIAAQALLDAMDTPEDQAQVFELLSMLQASKKDAEEKKKKEAEERAKEETEILGSVVHTNGSGEAARQ